jgi:hypothetical protein
MKSIFLGHDIDTAEEVAIPKTAFGTHFHLIGGTGKGKTTAIHTVLRPLLRDPTDRSCAIIIDRLGNLSEELLLWMASEEFCTPDVRERLVYIQPSREDAVMAFNPLLYETPAHGYYKVERATEIILRAWESVNIEAMPRLARWTFNAFWAAAQLGLTISDCSHLLMPGSRYHKPLLRVLPPRLQAEWTEIAESRSSEVLRILDSSRNRLKPYFESDILRRMFGTYENRLDIEGFMREGKIVLIDLAPRNRLASQLANTIGALILNEVIATARNLPRGVRHPTYLFLDEFQNFVGPDIEQALPEVRQLGLKLILSHQSFSQLERGDYDLTSMIFQAQSRMIFGLQGEDADILAHELASLTYDPRKIKEEIYTRRQLNSGHKVIELSSWSDANSRSDQWQQSFAEGWNRSKKEVRPPKADDLPIRGDAESISHQKTRGTGGTAGHTSTLGGHESIVPEYEEFLELASRTYESKDEQEAEWAKKLRKLLTGQCVLRLVDDPAIRRVKVKRTAPGYLKYDLATIQAHFPQVLDNLDQLIEDNFASDLFLSAETIDRAAERRLEAMLRPAITIQSKTDSPDSSRDPFS